MRCLFAFAFTLILLTTALERSLAQSAPRYSLHIPTAEEYLTALPSLIAQVQAEDNSKNNIAFWTFQKITTNELQANYTDLHSVKFDTLYNATSAVNAQPYDHGLFSTYSWHHLVFNAWLRENKVDLGTKGQWHFRAYTLEITSVDFNGDGQSELLVQLTYQPGDYPVYQELFVMQRDNLAPGKYKLVKMPWAFWSSAYCGVHEGCGGGAQTF